MDEKIFTTAGKKLNDLIASPFKAEEELQKLIAQHPKLLAWEQMNPGGSMRWIFVQREMGIAKDAGASDWWAVDHLFIDQDAVPTLVEVKRGADTRIRREVVGQMLEYAAHAWKTWTADSLRQTFEQTSADPDNELRELLDMDDDGDELWRDKFWQQVGDNLVAKRLRLLFVADDIPDELTRIVEFLNAAMEDVEVLAVKIKKYDGKSGLRTLVPHVIGRTAKPAGAKSQKLNRESFLAQFADERERGAARRLLDVADKYNSANVRNPGASIRYGYRKGRGISVAWINPPGVAGWSGHKDFTFGHLPLDDVRPEVKELLETWVAQFSDDGFVRNVSAKWGTGWRISATDAVRHIDTLVERLNRVLSDLRSIGAP